MQSKIASVNVRPKGAGTIVLIQRSLPRGSVRLAARRVAACVCVLAGLSVLPGGDAQALDILGLFGLGAKPPAPSPTTYPYELTIEAPGAPRDVRQAVEDASNLARLKTEAPGAADQLVRIAEADLPRITDALWGMGYYSASVVIEVAGAP